MLIAHKPSEGTHLWSPFLYLTEVQPRQLRRSQRACQHQPNQKGPGLLHKDLPET
jgi:hypothetical protein